MTKSLETSYRRPFNTPIESGLRSLFLLRSIAPAFRDLQRLVYYDYLLTHSSDVPGGPPSLHPSIPYRSGEWLVRRTLISDGLDLMYSKELVQKRYDKNGISFGATDLTELFLRHLTTDYARDLTEVANWVAANFESYSDEALSNYMSEHLGRWGAEFKREALLREIEL